MRKIFGHRGLPRIYKENTFTGINKAFEYCDFVEIDVRLTKDNNLILFHDPNIGENLIKDLTLAEIDILLNDGSLEDCLLTTRDQLQGKINFEIKTNTLDESQIDILFQKETRSGQNLKTPLNLDLACAPREGGAEERRCASASPAGSCLSYLRPVRQRRTRLCVRRRIAKQQAS